MRYETWVAIMKRLEWFRDVVLPRKMDEWPRTPANLARLEGLVERHEQRIELHMAKLRAHVLEAVAPPSPAKH